MLWTMRVNYVPKVSSDEEWSCRKIRCHNADAISGRQPWSVSKRRVIMVHNGEGPVGI